MAKERAIRRAEREREAAIKAAARAAEAERRERRDARKRAMTAWVPKVGVGKHQGVLARRRRIQNFVLVDLLLVLNIVTWFATDNWSTRVLVLVASALCFPVLKTLLFPR
ncbi:MAG TPA: hypothetical protein VLI04_19445 [Nocardioidaceae bacterium]|nr:hypothetical protein [Nocardioidaceae bacterium]